MNVSFTVHSVNLEGLTVAPKVLVWGGGLGGVGGWPGGGLGGMWPCVGPLWGGVDGVCGHLEPWAEAWAEANDILFSGRQLEVCFFVLIPSTET